MATQLTPLAIPQLGVYGLNKQAQDALVGIEWATEANNLVFSKTGVLESRKGFLQNNTTASARSLHEYIDASGNSLTIFAASNKIYKLVSGVATEITGTITTPTADNWQFANFNGKCVGYQSGHTPIELATIGGTFTDATGTQYQGNAVCSAAGRLWTIYNNTLYYSALLINDFDTTTYPADAGLFDLSIYWDEGSDEGTAIVEWNNYLVVFGKRSIIIYANPDDAVNTMVISENISGVGCTHRDTIQKIGNDLIFLSHTGLRSLGRVIQEKSTPLNDISQYVRDYVLDNVEDSVNSSYNQQEGFYLLSFPTANKTLAFDIRGRLPDNSTFRCTEWSKGFYSMLSKESGELLMSDASAIYRYSGYSDTAGSYAIDYMGGWTDFQAPYIKIPKRLQAFCTGTTGDSFTVKWADDYNTEKTSTTTLKSDNSLQVNLTGSGHVYKFGISSTINGTVKTMNRMTVQTKVGRL